MQKCDAADKLYDMTLNRFREEQPERGLTNSEKDGIWYTIYGKLCRGEPDPDVEEWCKTIPLNTKENHLAMRSGY